MSDVCVFGLYSQAKPYVVYVMSIVHENWKESFKTANWFLTFKEKDVSK